MKKLFTLTALLCQISYASLYANIVLPPKNATPPFLNSSERAPPRQELERLKPFHALLEAKAGYFYPTNPLFKKIYSGGGIYGLEASFQPWKYLYPWVSGSYFSKSGNSSGGDTHTVITFFPIGYGLKYVVPCQEHIDFYLGVGGLATYLRMQDRSPHVKRTTTNWGFGGIVKTGLLFNMSNSLFVDLYSDYSFIRVDFDSDEEDSVLRQDVSLSGFSFGVGLGYRF